MSKPKVTPTEFPINIEGKVQWVKKSEYAKAISSQLAIKLATDVKKSHIDQMIEAIEAGKKELGSDTPEEFVKVFNKVQEDYAEAQAQVVRNEEAEAKKAKEAEEAKKAQEAKELALFDSVKDSTIDFGTLAKSFDTGENMDRFVAKKDVTDEQLFAALNASFHMGEFSSWMKGDLVVALQDRGHQNVVTRLSEQKGIPFPSLFRMSQTSRQFPPSERQKGVSFTFYSEIANAKFSEKPEENAKAVREVVAKALTEGKTKAQEVRELVKAKQGKPAPAGPKPQEEDDKALFLVIDTQAESGQEVVTHKGFPKALFENGAIVVSLKTGKRFAENGFRKAAENRWLELPEYKAPEAAPEPAATPKKKASGNKKK